MKERDEEVVACQETALKALNFGEKAFKNAVEQVVALNPSFS